MSVYCRIHGRLGNQLWQYAVATIVSEKLGLPLRVCLTEGPMIKTGSYFKNVPELNTFTDVSKIAFDAVHKTPSIDIEKFVAETKKKIKEGRLNVYIESHLENFVNIMPYQKRVVDLYASDGCEVQERICLHVRLGDIAKYYVDTWDVYVSFVESVVEEINESRRKEGKERLPVLVVPEHAHSLVNDLARRLSERGNETELLCLPFIESFHAVRCSRYKVVRNSSFAWWACFLATDTTAYVGLSKKDFANEERRFCYNPAPSNFIVRWMD